MEVEVRVRVGERVRCLKVERRARNNPVVNCMGATSFISETLREVRGRVRVRVRIRVGVRARARARVRARVRARY